MLAIVNFIAAFTSVILVRIVPRKKLLIFGHASIVLIYILLAFFTVEKINFGVLCMILIFVFIY